ncbi:histone acetyltransferase KAT6A-like isoform X7 [Anoplophora glabripennis]|uniref:histone acetyltransferase KAT6A-like isoform X7 n=1 Tax=Anoplophora glabripennis TaxID=217634 RepID=UPI0008759FF2|nr:histone acetyltransferase KAT6A-like isoform X7 [Anoplophora glabripennis]
MDSGNGDTSDFYYYGAGTVIGVGLVIVFFRVSIRAWLCCVTKRSPTNGRVIAQPPPQEPVKPSPPPYNPNDYDNPPPYNACVPEELHQQQYGAASQQMSDPNCFAATAPPPKYFPPAPTHVVNIPENTARY